MDQDIREESIQDREPIRQSVKQVFGSLDSLDKLKERFVFYTPVTYYLIADQQRTSFSTDIISGILGNIAGEHPLVITELNQPVFDTEKTLLLKEGQRSFLRTIYAVQREIWNLAENQFRTLNIIDNETRRFCVLRPHTETIPCPFGQQERFLLDVYYFNCYGNKETYYFHVPEPILPAGVTEPVPSADIPVLHYRAPVREIIDISGRIFGEVMKPAVQPNAFGHIAQAVDDCFETQKAYEQRIAAIQKKNKLHETLAAKPLDESQLSVQARNECYDLIRRYQKVYGTDTNNP
jgi:hypothetical protein